MAIFDDPNQELERLLEQLLEEEENTEEDFDEEDFLEDYEYDEEEYDLGEEDYEEEPDEEPEAPVRPRSNRGLILLILAELAGICLIAAYWLQVIL